MPSSPSKKPSLSNKFIVFEGIEGAGKSTQVKLLEDYLQRNDIEVLLTREPGGTKISEKIRDLCLTEQAETLLPLSELLLMFAARVQHLETVIKPALHLGKTVISDRFVDASFAYQGGGRQMPLSNIEQLEKMVLGAFKPDYVVILDVPPVVGRERVAARGPLDRIESEKEAFFERVRRVYLERAQDKNNYFIIDAQQSAEKIHSIILQKVLNISI